MFLGKLLIKNVYFLQNCHIREFQSQFSHPNAFFSHLGFRLQAFREFVVVLVLFCVKLLLQGGENTNFVINSAYLFIFYSFFLQNSEQLVTFAPD